MNGQPPEGRPWLRSRSAFVLLAFLGIAGFFMMTEHRAHLLGALPYLLLLACPLLHFLHGGHGGHGSHGGDDAGSRQGGAR